MRNVFQSIGRRWETRKVLRDWEQAGRPAPPPHVYKQRTIREYAKRFGAEIFVETGTFQGDMIEAMRGEFRQMYSIELGVDLWKQARARFAAFDDICLRQGDSGVVLSEILADVEEPCLFWLDGHFSEGVTAKGALNTPIIRELQSIFSHPIRDHIVLIDDARLFVGGSDYPTLDALKSMIAHARPQWVMEVRDDMIRFHTKED